MLTFHVFHLLWIVHLEIVLCRVRIFYLSISGAAEFTDRATHFGVLLAGGLLGRIHRQSEKDLTQGIRPRVRRYWTLVKDMTLRRQQG